MIDQEAISIGAGGLYPYSDALYAKCAAATNFGDVYNPAVIVPSGVTDKAFLLVPRNMVKSYRADNRVSGQNVVFNSSFVPRNSEQARVVKETVEHLRDGKSFMVQSPTGSGKTVMSMEIMAQIGKKTLVVVTKQDIFDQWVDAAKNVLGLELGVDVGVIKGNVCNVTGKKLVIALVQSVSKMGRYSPSTFNQFGLVIFDEAHRVAADVFSHACYNIPAKLRLGISASGERTDGKSQVLRAHIGPTLVVSKQVPMIPKVIRQHTQWRVPLSKDRYTGQVRQVPHSPGKCMHIIKRMSHDAARNRLISNFVVAAFKSGRRIIVQSDTLEHLDILKQVFVLAGIPPTEIAFYVGNMTKAQYENAKTKHVILATYKMTAEGTDIPQLDTLVMATPKADVLQIVGRVIRQFEGKKKPVVFDLIDSDSPVFNGYANKRMKYYSSLTKEIVTY